MFACRKIDRLLVTYTTCGRSKKKSPRFKNSLWTVIIRVLKLQWKHLLQHLLTTTICNAQFKNILVLNIFDLTWNTQRAGKPVGSFDIKFLLSAFFNRLLNYDAVLFLVPTYFSSQGSILKAVRLFFHRRSCLIMSRTRIQQNHRSQLDCAALNTNKECIWNTEENTVSLT